MKALLIALALLAAPAEDQQIIISDLYRSDHVLADNVMECLGNAYAVTIDPWDKLEGREKLFAELDHYYGLDAKTALEHPACYACNPREKLLANLYHYYGPDNAGACASYILKTIHSAPADQQMLMTCGLFDVGGHDPAYYVARSPGGNLGYFADLDADCTEYFMKSPQSLWFEEVQALLATKLLWIEEPDAGELIRKRPGRVR